MREDQIPESFLRALTQVEKDEFTASQALATGHLRKLINQPAPGSDWRPRSRSDFFYAHVEDHVARLIVPAPGQYAVVVQQEHPEHPDACARKWVCDSHRVATRQDAHQCFFSVVRILVYHRGFGHTEPYGSLT